MEQFFDIRILVVLILSFISLVVSIIATFVYKNYNEDIFVMLSSKATFLSRKLEDLERRDNEE